MACVGLFLRLDIHCTSSRSCRRHGGALTSSISVQQVCVFSWCQSGLLVGCRDACWWVLSRWSPRRRVSPDDAARRQCLPSLPWLVVPLWISVPVCPHPAILGVSILYRRCWPYKGPQRLVLFVSHPRNGGAGIEHRSHRWELGADVIRGKMEGWALLSWHWLVNSANNERFGYS